MGCERYGNVIICTPSRFYRRWYQRCTTCECITEQVVGYTIWYGDTTWCCRCGESWDNEEGRRPRPFARNWRRDSARKARLLWDEATYGGRPTMEQMGWES